MLAQKGTKKAPGSVAPRNATRSGRSKSPPLDPITRAGHFGLFVSSGGLSFDRAPFSSRPTGAFFHRNLWVVSFYRTPPAACLPVRCGSGRAAARARLRTSCHSFARVGGVHITKTLLSFTPGRGLCPRGKKDAKSCIRSAGRKCLSSRRASPVFGGLGVRRL